MTTAKTQAELVALLDAALGSHASVKQNLSRAALVERAIARREAVVAKGGALATWTTSDSTGRSPKDTYLVQHPETQDKIDWKAPDSRPLSPAVFDELWVEAVSRLKGKDALLVSERSVGADPASALPLRMITDRATHALFGLNMFRDALADPKSSCLGDTPFTLLSLPYDRFDGEKWKGKLRAMPDGSASTMVVAHDFERRLGLVMGSAYCGSNKKMLFTTMNYLLPDQGILPMHCSANEGPEGDTALLLGLSGTGKTTLSADPTRSLLGDDEHAWSDAGIANFENGCYAKLINLRQDKEPEIWSATFREAPPASHGALIENCMVYPDGSFDVDDERLTPNSRVSYPLSSLSNIKSPPTGGHPRAILFLTADANGVLPPVAKLNSAQAMLWFLMGYTSKLAGTETGVTEPVSTFSRFFGAPFMPRNPDDYARLLGEKLARHGTSVYLINTGWSQGPYGVGKRMDINLTRSIVSAALSGALDQVEVVEDSLFHVQIPKSCPGVPSELLQPRATWADPKAYDARAKKLAGDFSAAFDKAYGDKGLDAAVVAACPGK